MTDSSAATIWSDIQRRGDMGMEWIYRLSRDIWTDQDGLTWLVEKPPHPPMTDSHAANLLAWLRRNAAAIAVSVEYASASHNMPDLDKDWAEDVYREIEAEGDAARENPEEWLERQPLVRKLAERVREDLTKESVTP